MESGSLQDPLAAPAAPAMIFSSRADVRTDAAGGGLAVQGCSKSIAEVMGIPHEHVI